MNSSHTDSTLYLQRLRRLDACAVSDALDKLGLRGTVSGLHQLSSSRRIAGLVTTVKLVSRSDLDVENVRQGPPRHLCTSAIEASGADHVIVVEQRTGLEAGSWGGILTLSAKLRGVVGVVAEGPVRDIDEARHYDFPIFARGLTAITARGRIVEFGTNIDIQVGDICVHEDDYVIADNSGVVFIAAAQIERVLEAAELISAREAAMAKALLDGQPPSQVMGATYELMLMN